MKQQEKENLAAGQALLIAVLLAGTILMALVYTAAMYVGAGLVIVGVALSIYTLARQGQAAKEEPQPIVVPVEEPEESKHRKAA